MTLYPVTGSFCQLDRVWRHNYKHCLFFEPKHWPCSNLPPLTPVNFVKNDKRVNFLSCSKTFLQVLKIWILDPSPTNDWTFYILNLWTSWSEQSSPWPRCLDCLAINVTHYFLANLFLLGRGGAKFKAIVSLFQGIYFFVGCGGWGVTKKFRNLFWPIFEEFQAFWKILDFYHLSQKK